MIHSEIESALSSLGIPVEFQYYEGEEETYITYSQYDENTNYSADDEEKAADLFYQVNLYSKGNYADIVANIKALLRDIGGERLNEVEFYDTNQKWYQRSMRFQFTR
jgi:hypothetical protein